MCLHNLHLKARCLKEIQLLLKIDYLIYTVYTQFPEWAVLKKEDITQGNFTIKKINTII